MEYNLAFGVYSELAKQVETQNIQVKEDTPIFTVLEPVSVPNLKSKPKRGKILVIWIFTGLLFGIVHVYGYKYYRELKENYVR